MSNYNKFSLWTKDWETPFGDVILGKEYLVSKRTIGEVEAARLLKEGYTDLLDGTFMTFYRHGNCSDLPYTDLNVAVEAIESLKLLDGFTDVTWEFSEEEGFIYNF